MPPDPKWLELLKASGWQTAAIATACGLFILFGYLKWIPPLESWMILLGTFTGLLCGLLARTSFLTAFFQTFPMHHWFLKWRQVHRAKKEVERYIPFMTKQEIEIIAYLLAKNQKTFTADSDGGHAATLLSRGIIMILARPGQHLDPLHVPMAIPDSVWEVLAKHRDKFPYAPRKGETEKHPWRVDWMER